MIEKLRPRSVTACRCHNHPNIVALKEVFLTKAHLAVVMEYVKGSNMPTFLAKHAPLPEDDARSAALPLLACCTQGMAAYGLMPADATVCPALRGIPCSLRTIFRLRVLSALLPPASFRSLTSHGHLDTLAGGSSSSWCWCSTSTTGWA